MQSPVRIRASRLALITAIALPATLVGAIAPAGALGAANRRLPALPSGALVLPPSNQCVQGNALTIRVHPLPRGTWISVSVNVNGRRVMTLGRSQLRGQVRLTRLPGRSFALGLTARATRYTSATITGEYHPCAPASIKPAPTTGSPKPTPTKPTAPTVNPPTAPTVPAPGSYAGSNSQGGSLAFYVSPDSHEVQDITIGRVALSCSNGTTQSDYNFGVAETTISGDGSFNGSQGENTLLGGVPATITYTFSGQFQGVDSSGRTRAAGQLREDISYTGGSSYTCTSNQVTWSATGSSQGSQAVAPPLSGSYAGSNSQGGSLSFYVSPGGQQVQDITIGRVALSCSNGTTQSDYDFGIAEASITNGSFIGSTTESAVRNGLPATITYTFSGRFHGLDTSGRTRAAGQLREDISYGGASSYSCTSSQVTWSATS